MRRLPLICLLLILALLVSGAGLAQEGTATADSAITEEAGSDKPSDLMKAQEFLATLAAELDTLRNISIRGMKAEDEEYQLLRVIADRHLVVIDQTEPKLLKLVPELDEEDPEVQTLRKGAADYFIAKFDAYEESLRFWSREIDSLRGLRSETPPEDLDELEAQIGTARDRLDSLLPTLADILEIAEGLGVETGKTWDRYDRAVQNRAENLVGRLQISVNARDSLRKKIETSERASAPEAEIGADRTRLQYADDRVKGVAKSLDRTVDILGSRGFETAPYRQFIIKTTGEISDKVLDPRVLFGLVKDGLSDFGGWLSDNGPTILVKLVIVVVIVLFFRLAFRLLWWLMRLVRMVKLTRLMVQLGNSMINPIATLIGLFVGFWFIGANLTTLLTGAGVAGVIIGFALQDSLSNLAAGFFILATRPFDVDDTIRTGTEVGTVKAMWIANTTIVTFDGRRLLIPNRKIWADIIENRSVEPLRRADITVRVGYEEDIDRTIEILLDLVRNEGRVLDHPEPAVFVSAWADSWVEVAVRPWTRNEDWWSLLKDLPRLVVLRFAEEGIEIPRPRMEMHGVPGAQSPKPEPAE